MDDPIADHEQKTNDKRIRRCGKESARLAHTAQIGGRDESDQNKTEKDSVIAKPFEAGSLSR